MAKRSRSIPTVHPVRTHLVSMVATSFALHILVLGVFHLYRFRTDDNHFGYGWEMGRIAESIALGHGFGNPYGGSTGPTAWEPPLYPYIIGGVFKVFGIYSDASAWVLLSLNSVFTALTSIPIFLIARKTMGQRVALWSAWTWAVLPYAMYWSLHWIWDASLTPLLLSLIFLVALELEDWPGSKGWATFGLLWGVASLSNASILSFLPFSGLWAWHRRRRRGLPSFGGVALASLLFFLLVSPWLIRNYRTFGKFVFIRDDFGYELRLGNGLYADGRLMAYLQPNLNRLELESYSRLGEQAYEARCHRLAFTWIHEHPGRFFLISLKRSFYYWDNTVKATNSTAPVDFRNSLFLASSVLAIWGLGRALRKKKPGAWLFFWLVAVYPTIYYFVYPGARYRHPIEPELLILLVFLLSEVELPRFMGGSPLVSGDGRTAA
ncbi:MAG TPA: glycosyltransferase family 39 protein [Terriglobales bacterium]|nr:glycosyltransferase family 39 protein [Terriglobales bacterium]